MKEQTDWVFALMAAMMFLCVSALDDQYENEILQAQVLDELISEWGTS